jgi:CBS domain-containing protein
MTIKVHEIMTASVITTQPHASIAHVRGLMKRNKIGSIPVIDKDGHPVGIVSSADLLMELKSGTPVSTIMTKTVLTLPKYDDVSTAARVMRNHKIHHIVITHEKKVVGLLSSFDLLRLVENHRFVAKRAPTESTRKRSKRS